MQRVPFQFAVSNDRTTEPSSTAMAMVPDLGLDGRPGR